MGTRKIGLDLLRSLAILIVIEQHGRAIIGDTWPIVNAFGITDGVDLFFVLSGFLIGGILIRSYVSGSMDVKTFLIRRWYRTLPNYYVALLMSLIVYCIFNFPGKIDSGLILRTGFFVQNYIPPFSDFSFFSEAWSLSIEEHFYLTFAIVLLIVSKFLKGNGILIAIIVLSLIAIAVKILILASGKINSYDDYNSYIRIIIPCRFDSLCIGVFFAFIKSRFYEFYHSRKNALIMFLVGLIMCIAFDRTRLAEGNFQNPILSFYSLFFSIGVGLTIPFVENIEIRESIFKGIIHHIAKVSYSLYLFHNFIFIQPVAATIYSMDHRTKVYFYFVYWIFIFSVSYFAYNFVEKPFLALRDKKYPETLHKA